MSNGRTFLGTRNGGIGGQDNLNALVRAWDLASEKTNSVVLWIHGPQPVELATGERLHQRLTWRSAPAQGGPGFYQLVTSVSGAVVLENRQQFEQARLTPVDASTVPVVPEPGVMALLILGAILAAARGRRKMAGLAGQPGCRQARGAN